MIDSLREALLNYKNKSPLNLLNLNLLALLNFENKSPRKRKEGEQYIKRNKPP